MTNPDITKLAAAHSLAHELEKIESYCSGIEVFWRQAEVQVAFDKLFDALNHLPALLAELERKTALLSEAQKLCQRIEDAVDDGDEMAVAEQARALLTKLKGQP